MTVLSLVWQWVLACLAIAGAVYFPGRLLLRILRAELDRVEHLAAALLSGMAMLVLVYYTASWLGQPWLLWIWLPGCLLTEGALLFRDWQVMHLRVPDPDAVPPESWTSLWPLGLLLLAGLVLQARYTVLTGWVSANGVKLLAWHAHDAPWHIYNLAQLVYRFPPEMPGFAGVAVQNYHIFSDLFWAALLHYVPLDPWHCYFRIAPLFYSALLSLAMFAAGRAWSGKDPVAYLATGMTLLLSNFGYLFPWLAGWGKSGIWDSLLLAQSPHALIFNPGVSSSFSVFLLGLWALTRWLKKTVDWEFLLLLVLFWGVLPGFKIYPWLLVIAALLVTGLILGIVKRNFSMWIALGAMLPLSLAVFLPGNMHSASLLRWLPGFNLATLLVAPDRLALMASSELKLLYVQHPWQVALIMGVLAVVFLVGNLGVRAIGLFPMLAALRRPRVADPILLFMAVLGGGAWLAFILFVQEGIAWNTVQFFYYAVLISALPAAGQFWAWIKNSSARTQIIAVVVLAGLGLPGVVDSWLKINWSYAAPGELVEAMNWINQHSKPQDVILRPLPDELITPEGYARWQRTQVRGRMTDFNAWKSEAQEMAAAPAKAGQVSASGNTVLAATLATSAQVSAIGNTTMASAPEVSAGSQTNTAASQPLGAAGLRQESASNSKVAGALPPLEQTDVAIVTALSMRNTYFEDTVSSQIKNFPVAERFEAVRAFYTGADVMQAREFLGKEHITYVLLFAGKTLPFDPAGVPLKAVYQNRLLTVYKYLLPNEL